MLHTAVALGMLEPGDGIEDDKKREEALADRLYKAPCVWSSWREYRLHMRPRVLLVWDRRKHGDGSFDFDLALTISL